MVPNHRQSLLPSRRQGNGRFPPSGLFPRLPAYNTADYGRDANANLRGLVGGVWRGALVRCQRIRLSGMGRASIKVALRSYLNYGFEGRNSSLNEGSRLVGGGIVDMIPLKDKYPGGEARDILLSNDAHRRRRDDGNRRTPIQEVRVKNYC